MQRRQKPRIRKFPLAANGTDHYFHLLSAIAEVRSLSREVDPDDFTAQRWLTRIGAHLYRDDERAHGVTPDANWS